MLLSETYLILLLNAAGKRTDLCEAQYSAGIVLGGIYDLLWHGCIREQPGGRLSVAAPLPEVCSGLREIYRDVNRSPKSRNQLTDYYCCGLVSKNTAMLLESLYESLERKGLADTVCRRGIFRQKTEIRLRSDKNLPVVEHFRKNVKNLQLDNETVFCIQMLWLADVLKKYFPIAERMNLRSAVRQCSGTQMWRHMEPYVNKIKNFNYQNAVNAGAVYQ